MISNIREIMGTQNIPPFLYWASIRSDLCLVSFQWVVFIKHRFEIYTFNKYAYSVLQLSLRKILKYSLLRICPQSISLKNISLSNILVNNVMDVELWMSFVKSYISKYFTFWRFCFLFKRKEKTGNEFVKDILLSRYKGK